MKRYPVVIGATVAGLAGVLSFHSQSGTLSLPRGTASRAASTAQGAPAHTAPPSTTPPTTPPTTGSSQRAATSSATGTPEQYGYGQLSVRVTMSGGKIVQVAVATLQTADTYSQQLADQVIPILRREVLSAQSARISGLTGATYTSEAYAASVQSALDKLHK